ncbi:MAG: methionyl-tRNA formyltransferase [Armatimonadetes bacterium]|nr:methionyl-tRNA formyltransferase [Armatimonadota bacterium]
MGTDDFAVPSLEKLAQNEEIVGVVTQPDKEKGRGYKLSASPIKLKAHELNLKIYQPESLKDSDFLEILKNLSPEIILVIAYGKLIPEVVFNFPPLGAINFHPSLLPEYRGAIPIEAAIMAGEEETGLSVFFLDQGFDTGDILLQEKVKIDPEDTGGTLREKLADLGADFLIKAINLIKSRNFKRIPQDKSAGNYTYPLKNEDALIKWEKEALKIHNLIRALAPKPAAFTFFRGKILKILESEVIQGKSKEGFGKIIDIFKNKGILVTTGRDLLLILKVKLEGKKEISAGEFICGMHPQTGEFLR